MKINTKKVFDKADEKYFSSSYFSETTEGILRLMAVNGYFTLSLYNSTNYNQQIYKLKLKFTTANEKQTFDSQRQNKRIMYNLSLLTL